MKWDKPNGSTQHTADKTYCIVRANERDVIAYNLGLTTGKDLGRAATEEEAREICEEYDTMRKRA